MTDESFGGNVSVLIETLWNVKLSYHSSYLSWQVVLIETLWNVKLIYSSIARRLLSFNRNIVECKV